MDINYVRKYMPSIELSYDSMNHNKVYDLYMAIPYGKKFIIWFTYYENKNVCILIEYNQKNKEFINVETVCVSYDKYICGTILYGTIFYVKNIRHFATENILYHCHNNIQEKSFLNKLNLLNNIFNSSINNIILFKNQMIVGMCIITNNKNDIINSIENLSYDVFAIMSKNSRNNSTMLNILNKNKEKSFVFTISPDITNDIYKLHIHSGVNGVVFYQNAFIPNYKTSVMMNNYFRIIKENENLDLLEESDDEEEFENINPDKFVYLNKQLNFECIYNTKFKKWVPIKKTNNKKIVNLTTIKSIVCNK